MANYVSTHTGEQIDNGVDIALNNVLTKDNTISFTPSGDYNPATKKYVDDTVGALPVLPTGGSAGQSLKKTSGDNYAVEWGNVLPGEQGYSGSGEKLQGASDANTSIWLAVAQTATESTIPKREANGNITVGTPSDNSHATSKSYVDGLHANIKWEGTQAQYDALTTEQKAQYLFYVIT
jgi:hypothetical protein